ncbi:aldehyde dehydrogenase family protein [Chitinophagaceae bacterium LB-8]|uniref:Aldehyde dehydrogenase n=1 Tax=Paraflavisolibacter caeni TaxID=2982496 RepID=A0A9X2XP63_9BACT|nr:aldehyde dehydrogenase family protein [Paraflavisolibacter caeni]MCU7550528.1 aldehyde dehydrogenase family protein [Paraflavisolibacter caeni]
MSYLPQLQKIQQFFDSGATRSYEFRMQQLQRFKDALYKYEQDIYNALYVDLKKNKEECWVTEIGFIVSEINYALGNLKRWMKPQKTGTNLLNFPSKSFVINEPLGVVLVIGPWNYPLQLVLTPLIGVIAAGNCAVVKPSEFAPAAAAIIKKILQDAFPSDFVSVIEGEGHLVVPGLMNNFRFGHVFYTGNTKVGKMIYQMAAQQLVPVTLELGGKSPCIIEPDANIDMAARRIAVPKFSNAGQMCVAPDYVLVHESIKEEFIVKLKNAIDAFYNADNVREYNYGKIINKKQFNRLLTYLVEGTVIYGGSYNEASLYLQPTLLTNVSVESKVMQEEIFGPVLPILTWSNDEDVYRIIERNNDPLALYIFTSSDAKADKWMKTISFGGGCINNASWQLTNYHLPFGGRGNSGIGAYHGKYSFETFSHKKAIMKTPTWFDPALKYPPFKGKLNWFKKIIR